MKITTLGDVTKEIRGYGFNYSIKDFSKQLLLIFLGIIGAGLFFQISLPFIAFCVVFMFILLPYVYRAQFKFIYEAKKFDDAVLYMTQMIACFKKSNKILLALKETREVVDDEIGMYIDEAIAYIEEGDCVNDIYREALSIIEEKYGCGRMKSLHDFLAKVESSGGEFEKALNILNDDIEEWSSRTYIYQKERKNIRNKITIAIGLTFIICAVSKQMIPEQFDFTTNMLYQVVTTAAIALICLFYTIVQSTVIGSWLDSKSKYTEKKIDEDYKKMNEFDVKKAQLKWLPFALAFLAISVYAFITGEYLVSGICIASGFVLYTQPKRDVRAARNRLEKEILRAFPDWLRSLSISMQTKTVRVSIRDSLTEAPYILRSYIANMLESFENGDSSINPYINFISDFDLKEVSGAMRSLYAFNKASTEESEQQINSLIKRNNEMLAKAEVIKNEDTTSLCGFMVIMPMFIGCLKLVVDMVLMFASFTTNLGASI